MRITTKITEHNRKEEILLLSHSDEIVQVFHLIPFSPEQTKISSSDTCNTLIHLQNILTQTVLKYKRIRICRNV